MKKAFLVAMVALFLTGCMSAAQHREGVQDGSADQMTVGKVQKEIRIGMSGAEVTQVLGSPNIVSTDGQRREVWMYDKITTDISYSTSSGGVSVLILGRIGSSGAISKSQRTLTIIIKFDESKKVRDFAYHTSRF